MIFDNKKTGGYPVFYYYFTFLLYSKSFREGKHVQFVVLTSFSLPQ